MDIDLGAGIDGTEAAKTILESRDIPIIFLTSHSEKEYVDRVKKITGYGYVFQPHVDIQNPATLGLQLISTLIDQIEGTLDLTRRPTPQYRIKFSGESD